MRTSRATCVWWMVTTLALSLIGGAVPVRAEEITLDESQDVLGSQKGEGKLAHKEFLVVAVEDLTKLDTLFFTDASTPGLSDPVGEWNTICKDAVTHINEARRLAVKHAPGKDPGAAALAWYDGLLDFWSNLQIKGRNAYAAKVKLDLELAHRKKSRTQNATYKKDYWEALEELDAVYGDGQEFLDAASDRERAKVRRRLDRDYAGGSFIEGFANEASWAANHTTAAKNGRNAVTANKKQGDPKILAQGLDGLDECVVQGEESVYGSFVRTRAEWAAAIDSLYEEYEKEYDAWLKELAWILEDTMFKETSNLRDCTWDQLGTWFANMNAVVQRHK